MIVEIKSVSEKRSLSGHASSSWAPPQDAQRLDGGRQHRAQCRERPQCAAVRERLLSGTVIREWSAPGITVFSDRFRLPRSKRWRARRDPELPFEPEGWCPERSRSRPATQPGCAPGSRAGRAIQHPPGDLLAELVDRGGAIDDGAAVDVHVGFLPVPHRCVGGQLERRRTPGRWAVVRPTDRAVSARASAARRPWPRARCATSRYVMRRSPWITGPCRAGHARRAPPCQQP